jgi:oligopeptide/dipeptide ABC transporter ATP-binding protein
MTKARTTTDPLLQVRDLSVDFGTLRASTRVVDRVSFDVHRGEVLGMVGESGSGKSVTAMSILRLHTKASGCHMSGSIQFKGEDLAGLSNRQLRRVRGREISMIFQDPMTSLNPVHTIGAQIAEAVRAHHGDVSPVNVRSRSLELLRLVGVPDPESRLDQYPHQFSGGMRQRAMIAIALANHPALLIADEPTTALDVTIQAQVLRILDRARREEGAAALLITHDLGVIAELADRVVVMYAGRVLEIGDVMEIFHRPLHPYTAALMASVPSRVGAGRRISAIPGNPPDSGTPHTGCPFEPRCFLGKGRLECQTTQPELMGGPQHLSACHFSSEMPAAAVAAGIITPRDDRDPALSS